MADAQAEIEANAHQLEEKDNQIDQHLNRIDHQANKIVRLQAMLDAVTTKENRTPPPSHLPAGGLDVGDSPHQSHDEPAESDYEFAKNGGDWDATADARAFQDQKHPPVQVLITNTSTDHRVSVRRLGRSP